MTVATSGATAVLTVVYDLRRDDWGEACRHAKLGAGSIPMFITSTPTTSRSCSVLLLTRGGELGRR